MDQHELKQLFSQQAATYDQQWSKMAPLRDALQLLIAAAFADLPERARILSVGAGTGAEILFLAERFPRWEFTAVEPAGPMLEVCRRLAEEHGIAARCVFHEGYLDSLPRAAPFDAATALLVSQFMLDAEQRCGFFRTIAQRLRPNGLLACADLASDTRSPIYADLSEIWFRAMQAGGVSPEGLERMRSAYSRDVAILPEADVRSILESSGFTDPLLFFQAGLIHAWFARRA